MPREDGAVHDLKSITDLVRTLPEGDPLVAKKEYIQPLGMPGCPDHAVRIVPKWARKLKGRGQGTVEVIYEQRIARAHGCPKARKALKAAIPGGV